jgi:outer membrane immunogenic protein
LAVGWQHRRCSNSARWTAGAGFEYALWKNLTLKAEYLYVSLGSQSLTETAVLVFAGFPTPSTINTNYGTTSFNVGRVGLNYRF